MKPAIPSCRLVDGRTILANTILILISFLASNSVLAQTEFVTPGANTNIVGITPNISNIPDFQLKQQQEPSCIVRPGNESYIFCAYNDLRASDLPAVQGDSWMGVSMSNDGGQTWFSRLSPGYLGHINSMNMGFAADPSVVAIPGNSPGLAILNFIAAFRDSDAGVLAIQRWVEFPQEDQDFWKPEDNIYIIADGSEGRFHDKPSFLYIAVPSSQQGTITEQIFVEGESSPVEVTTPTGTLVVAYSVFTGSGGTGKVFVSTSPDNGHTWTHPQKISEEQTEVTGVSLTSIGDDFVVVYRRKGDSNDPDAVVSAHCALSGNKRCTKAEVVFEVCPFDQQATGSTHRTFTFPWSANDGKRYWAFAADRRFANDASCTPVPGAPGLYSGKPRIVGMSSVNGKDWVGAAGNEAAPFVVAPRAEGFQVMPTAFGTKGRIDIAWYDTFREEQVGLPAGNNNILINDYTSGPARVFRKADVWMTRLTASCSNNASAGCTPSVETPVRVSRFPSVIESLQANVRQEVQAHLPNLRMYASGTLAFNGDYIALATPAFRKLANGKWIPNSLPEGAGGAELPGYTNRQNLYVAWGDNRDVKADFTGPSSTLQLPYTPPLNSDANPGGPVVKLDDVGGASDYKLPGLLVAATEPDDDPLLPSDLYVCTPESFDFSHSRDSNIYGSLVQDMPSLVAPTPSKPLGTIQRMFPLEITNIDAFNSQDFCLHIVDQPSDFSAGAGMASFYQLPAVAPFADGDQLELLDVTVQAGSSASRAAFVTTADGTTVINVNAYQGACPATTAGPFGALVNAIQLSDGPLFDPVFCETNACDPVATNETHNITLASPVLQARVLRAPSFEAPSFEAPVLEAPVLEAPSFEAPSFEAPSFEAPVLEAPSFEAPSFEAPVLEAPSLEAPSLEAGTLMGDAEQDDLSVQDITYVVRTNANVTTTYSADIAMSGLNPDESIVQLIAWTPNIYATSNACFAVPQANQQIIAYTQLDAPSLEAVTLPTAFSPDNQNPYAGELSFTGSSGKDIAITIRIWSTGTARQTLLDLDAELQACMADENCDPDAENLGAQQLISFGASAHSCATNDAQGNTMNPGQPDCLNNGFEKIFVDKTPPAFNVAPNTTFEFEADLAGGAVIDLAAGPVTASDNGVPVPVVCYETDGSGTILNTLPELLDIGSYPILCEATDAAGNTGSVPLTVDVADNVNPVIVLNGDPAPTIEAGDVFTDAGATGTDIRGTTIIDLVVVVSGVVDTSVPDVYTLSYAVTDTGGNTVTATRTVTVVDTTPPVLSNVPTDISGIEASGPGGATVTWPAPSANDIVDGALAVSCVPASGSLFAVGPPTTVICSATDSAGNNVSASFSVTVVDNAPPVVSPVADISGVEASGPSGAIVNFTNPAAVDIVAGALATVCVPPSGSTFAIGGPHIVTCSATDSAGNTGSTMFSITVVDTGGPVVDILPDLTVEATGAGGAIASWTNPAANDIVDGALASTCSPTSGTTFALGGPHVVTCSATDSAGNPGSSSFNVTVQDTTAPTVTASDINVSTFAAIVNVQIDFVSGVTATDIVDGNLAPVCSIVNPGPGIAQNGNILTITSYGTWTASCSAIDAAGNTGTKTFSVTVGFPLGIKLVLPKGNITAGSTVPIDWHYLESPTSNTVVASAFIAPAVSWIGPYAPTDSNCSGTTSGMGSGEDSGSSSKRYTASKKQWQFSWQTPSLAGRYKLVIMPPGSSIPAATACIRTR